MKNRRAYQTARPGFGYGLLANLATMILFALWRWGMQHDRGR